MFHFCDCLTLFVLISFGLDEITAQGVNHEQRHLFPSKAGRKSSEASKNEDDMISTYPHFESKSILPSHDPQHRNICWKKCSGSNVKNMREILLRKQNELLGLRKSDKRQARTRKSCGEHGCESESSTVRPVQHSKGSEPGSKESKPMEFTKIFMTKASRSESGNVSMFQYVFAKNTTL